MAGCYTRAREVQQDVWADECISIADDGTTDYVTKVGRNGHEYEAVDQEHIQRSRLRVDTRLRIMAVVAPHVYGPKVEHQHDGEVTHKVDITGLPEREKMRRMALFMLEDQAAGETIDGEAEPIHASPPTQPAKPTKSDSPAAAQAEPQPTEPSTAAMDNE